MSSIGYVEYLSDELQLMILQYMNAKTLLICRSTCTTWYRIITDDAFWFKRLKKKLGPEKLEELGITPDFKWHWSYAMCEKLTLGINLLESPELVLSKWNIVFNEGNGWSTEYYPMGSFPIPLELGVSSCFSTSYDVCMKTLWIDLYKYRFDQEFLNLQPIIHVGEWYTNYYNSPSYYEIKIQLYDSDGAKMGYPAFNNKHFFNELGGQEWRRIWFQFTNYGTGLRYIKFRHGGRDNRLTDGHYGPKMAAQFLYLTLK